jgi:prepilin-type N-terminal cleavage/methylation domain-containing protein
MGRILPKRQSGFTLVELLVALGIASIALAAVFSVYWSVTKSSTRNEVTAEVLQSLRTSIVFLEQDLRMAGLDRFGAADAGIESATATSIRITADRNMNGAIDAAVLAGTIEEIHLERITYAYDAVNRRLRQCLSEGTPVETWDTVAENVQGFQLAYFDSDDTALVLPIADLTLIRSVAVSMTVAEPAGLNRTVSRTMNKRILCRNLSF